MDDDARSWHVTQGNILTGEGKLLRGSALYCDFLPQDLPHYLLSRGLSKQMFKMWLSLDRRSSAIVGCWSRPLFAGGFLESTETDTEAFNLQTPSIFIDMRFPRARSTLLSRHRSLEDCSIEDLRSLGRQHCFAGYSLPEPFLYKGIGEVITRHHVIDWNYHPCFARPRPNRWWVEMDPRGHSFKEHSVIRDEFGIPVYFERWQRREPHDDQRSHYLAMRRSDGRRDGVLVVVGCHFAVALDRPPIPSTPSACTGAGAVYLDYLLEQGQLDAARDFLRLEGHYGRIQQSEGVTDWRIVKSTHPWREGQQLFPLGQHFEILVNEATHTPQAVKSSQGEAWDVLECSFSLTELQERFGWRPKSKL